MFSFLLKLVTFIGIGLFLTLVPEWQNNVLINGGVSGWSGYFNTILINSVLLFFSYLTFKYLNKKYSPTKTLILQFTIWGIIGLLFEWIVINHPPWSSAIQYGMFVYWAVVFGSPALFLLEQTKSIRMKFLGFIFTTSVLMILGSIVAIKLDPTKGLLLFFIIISWILSFSIAINFFFKGLGYQPKIKLLLSVAILVPIAEMVLPYPLDFITFVMVIIYLYWYTIKKLSLEKNSI